MCDQQIEKLFIDTEKEDFLTDLLKDLYDRWESCSNSCGADDEKKEEFLRAIKNHLNRGFSIITHPGIYDEEKGLENLLHVLYREWDVYVQDVFEPDVEIFIDTARTRLDDDKESSSWKDIEIK